MTMTRSLTGLARCPGDARPLQALRALRALLSAAAGLALCFALAWPQAATAQVGIVLMHGKWGSPRTHINTLAESLRAQGYRVVTPLMAWSRARGYDVGYPESLQEIADQVRALRAGGVTQVFVAGQSFGANAALAYAARGAASIDGVIAIAPGHTPDQPGFRAGVASGLRQAQALVAAGRGDEFAVYDDFNSGRRDRFRMQASTYVSYFDPAGWAAMPLSAQQVKVATPLLWILGGEADILSQAGKAYAFDLWPAHPASRYHVVDSNHLDAPTASVALVTDWLSAVTGR